MYRPTYPRTHHETPTIYLGDSFVNPSVSARATRTCWASLGTEVLDQTPVLHSPSALLGLVMGGWWLLFLSTPFPAPARYLWWRSCPCAPQLRVTLPWGVPSPTPTLPAIEHERSIPVKPLEPLALGAEEDCSLDPMDLTQTVFDRSTPPSHCTNSRWKHSQPSWERSIVSCPGVPA